MAKFLREIKDYSFVELGSGFNPQPGFVHVEMTDQFPEVDLVCDLSKETLPIPNGSVSEMLAYHVIEHFPWRSLPRIVSDWARVIKPGGKITIRTPNLRKICEQYLKGDITKEWPGDMDALKEIFGDFGPSQWALVKLFSGQDYPGNTHFFCLDENSAEQLFTRNGFANFTIVDLGHEFSPFELQFKCNRV